MSSRTAQRASRGGMAQSSGSGRGRGRGDDQYQNRSDIIKGHYMTERTDFERLRE